MLIFEKINHWYMKKLITAILLISLAMPLFAQEPVEQKWTVRASAGLLPSVPTIASLFGAIAVGIAVSANEDSNETLDIDLPPYFGLDVLYNFNSRWSAGLSTGYTGCVWNVVDKDTRDIHSKSFLTFIPVNAVGRCNYLNRPNLKLYGSLEAGVMLSVGGDSLDLTFDAQLNPIGVEFGKTVFGMVEAGVGMNYFGGRIGIGYRF
jgi:hypothetical protein